MALALSEVVFRVPDCLLAPFRAVYAGYASAAWRTAVLGAGEEGRTVRSEDGFRRRRSKTARESAAPSGAELCGDGLTLAPY
jgi:hypothetical protein